MNSKILTIFIALLIASCGGGSGGSSEKQPSSPASQISSSISSISSSTSSSSSSSGEAINGHIVPPEPDPILNDSTLEGIDVNKNGVRDDVERTIAGIFDKKDEHEVAFNSALKLQLVVTSDEADIESAMGLYKEFVCDTMFLGEFNQELIKVGTFNTNERRDIFNKLMNTYPTSKSVEDDSDGNPINPCAGRE